MEKKQILMQQLKGEVQIGMLENRRLAELLIENEEVIQTVGNIYWGKVQRVVEGLQAAFIDIGEKTDGFLHFSDVGTTSEDYQHLVIDDDDAFEDDEDEEDIVKPSEAKKQPLKKRGQQTLREKRRQHTQMIASKLTPGDMILVQVIKEPIGNKGYRLTSDITIAGHFVVLLPFGGGSLAISKRINNRKERKRLRMIVKNFEQMKNCGAIIRTVAEDQNEDILKRDVSGLISKWVNIENLIKKAKRPMLVHREDDIITSTLRDYLKSDVDEIITNSQHIFRQTQNFLTWASPQMEEKLRLYKGRLPLFDAYGVAKDAESITKNKIWLRSGGYIIIEHTEAMVVIDVNSGKYTARKEQEENSLKTNLEAAREVAHQLRLRDIGGIIVVDFIDLLERDNTVKVYDALRAELKLDRARSNILPMSEFGIIQITRERIRPSLTQRMRASCPTCNGTGILMSKKNTFQQIERWLRKYALSPKAVFSKLQLRINPELLKDEGKPSFIMLSIIWFAQHLIRGESTNMGRPCIFVRLTGCDLRCSYCDTKYAYHEGQIMSMNEVLQTIQKYPCSLILITGGEPLLQHDCYMLLTALCDNHYEVMLETSGHILTDAVDKRVKKIIDMKTPSSLMSKKNNYENLKFCSMHDEVKFVIGSKEDYEWSKHLILTTNLTNRTNVLFSPVFETLPPLSLATWILTDAIPVRFQIQLHKYIWEPNTKGV
ncbi:hypothetical protein CHS0354_023906 [Potamilus streckersoni]|uniref:7-carboxy-7-deazaguanine synthase n=1 Tax=Potamilus streckersoni TaxID=2493646 RepID=A0AAE0VMK7_9BIVA|nr:hypothetical protein CHS0354_023906 [Potamilus streckersoni]